MNVCIQLCTQVCPQVFKYGKMKAKTPPLKSTLLLSSSLQHIGIFLKPELNFFIVPISGLLYCFMNK